MLMETRNLPCGPVIAVSGRLDSVTCSEFEAYGAKLVGAQPLRMGLDLERLEYISSAGLRSILCLAKELQKSGGTLVLCGPKGMVAEVIGMAGLDNLLPVCDSVEDFEEASGDK